MDFATLAAGLTHTGSGLAEINAALGIELPKNTWDWHFAATNLERVRYSTVPFARCLTLLDACLESASGLAHEWVDRWQWHALAVRWEAEGSTWVTIGVGWRTPHQSTPVRVWPELAPWSRKPEANLERCVRWAKTPAVDRLVVKVTRARAPATQRRDEALLASIVADPDDATRRLVYADLLEERGDPRGELIRLQLTEPTNPRVAQLLTASWSSFAGELAPFSGPWAFHRGFVEKVQMTIAAFAKHGERLFSTYPLQELEIRQQFTARQLDQLATARGVRLVRKLRLLSIHSTSLSPLWQADFGALRELDVLVCEEGHQQLFASLAAPRLERVRIAGVAATREQPSTR